MMEGFDPRLVEIFDAAVRLEPDRREEFLARACGGDDALRARATALLKSHDEAHAFLEEPALGRAFRLGDKVPPPAEPPRLGKGVRLGLYEVEELLGSGGMASVYLARRADAEFERRVAIKLIRPGMASEAVVARFRRERQVLATLNHPNIARLLDGGTTEDGLPYLVMELVEGEPITSYCDRRRLPTAQRLELFRAVCSAVHYAHRNLVLHRDLKPSNILVTADGEPKLLDFGIAKLLDPDDASSRKELTATTERFFTPEYASPEQVRGEPMSTATDIYSLGVVLYELLTGHRPYRFTTRSPHEVERVIEGEDPARPSTVIDRVEEVPTFQGTRVLSPESVSSTRDGRPEKLRRCLAGDMDTIVLKALRKEPERRYASAEEISEDIRRHLAGLPVLARKDTIRYRTGKFLGRHRAAVLGGILVLCALAAGVSSILHQQMKEARDRKEAARHVLELLGAFSSEPSSASRREAYLRALETKEADRLSVELRSQPEDLVEYADTIAGVCEDARLLEAAARWRRLALDVRREALSGDQRALADAHFRFAWASRRTMTSAGLEAAAQSLREAKDLRRRAPGGGGVSLPAILREQALVLWSQGDYDGPLRLFEESLEDPGEDLVAARVTFAEFLAERGDLGRAVDLLGAALDLAAQDEVLLADVEWRLGEVLWCTPRFREAEPRLRRALTAYYSHLPEQDLRTALCLMDLAVLTSEVRPAMSDLFAPKPAIELWRQAHRRTVEAFSKGSLEDAESLHTLSIIITGGFESEPVSRKSLEILEGLLPPRHPRLARPLTQLGATFQRATDPDLAEGERHLELALAIRRENLPRGHWETAITAGLLGANLAGQERYAESEPLLLESLEAIERTHGPAHPRTGTALRRVVSLYDAWGKEEDARPYSERLRARRWGWPFGRVFGEHDATAGGKAGLDFDDDYMEKAIDLPEAPQGSPYARLWIYGRPFNVSHGDFTGKDDHHILVNGVPGQVVSFNVGRTFCYFTQDFQWVPIDIPVAWLRRGTNRFAIYEGPYIGWKAKGYPWPWEIDNLEVGVDTERQGDLSWWYGNTSGFCCDLLKDEAQYLRIPFDERLEDHREHGYERSRGELMIFLELSP
ncbi:MAG: serine/threonine protein kinase [Planctomycetes bacterium]|nr:serine/threonine protein kinase [Planctomycetota bacterium]